MNERLFPGRINVSGLAAVGHHGVYPQERREGQRFVVDLSLELPIASNDLLASTVNYATLSAAVVDIVAGEPCDLIETLAHRVADRCLQEPVVDAVTVVVHKPDAPMGLAFTDVNVTLRKTRR